ncbi:uncharacterized protein KGF55_002580 [Candida pseudojiufengensis]|uniref:uncharacterized protein n=1 Tax=Candida pseudojiufengensis TaxID=497109 RepID=UPI0022240976|nr:uncharacterized protein KGF55_002580 [Candida pseudojiufengensis]KAI5963700.1 hypothetical protein KGF55_002580 [Candida pseudojiufengensis]
MKFLFTNDILPPISIKTIITCLIWYLVSSITSQLTKIILTKFTYPLFLSQCQFLIGALLAYIFILISRKNPFLINHFPKGSIPSIETHDKPILSIAVLLKIFPLGLFQFLGKYFSLSATSLIPLPTISSIKALSPLLIVLGYRIIYKVIFPVITYLSLVPLLLGVILIITSDSIKNPNSKTNLLTNDDNEIDQKQINGILLCLISTIIFAGQNIYGKQLITWDNNDEKLHNPASLVLNTDISRPSTPFIPSFKFQDENEKNGYFQPHLQKQPSIEHIADKEKLSVNDGPYNENDHKTKNNDSNGFKYLNFKQRSNSLKLPYSTSDLSLDQMKENHLLTPPLQQSSKPTSTAYQNAVFNNNLSINNPFGFLVEKFDLNKISKPDKLTIILYCSLIGSSFSISGFLMNELPSLYNQLTISTTIDSTTPQTNTTEFLQIMILIVLDSLSHFLQTLLAFHLLGSIPALSYSIASMLKRIVLITISILLTFNFNNNGSDLISSKINNLTFEQIIGLILIGIGLYCYDRWGSRSLKPK